MIVLYLAQHIDVGSLLGEFGKCHSGGGHRVFLQIKVDGSHLNLIRAHDGHPDRDGRRCAASRFGLRPPRLAAQRKTYTTSWDINTDDVLELSARHAPGSFLPR
ncbi:MAG: hypothetical protein ABI887_09770 [Burkholderiales bacterium]